MIAFLKKFILVGTLLAPTSVFAQTCIGTPPLTEIIVDQTIDICLPTNNANQISALALRQTLTTMTSAIFQFNAIPISGTPLPGYIPVATSTTNARWTNIMNPQTGTTGLGVVETTDTSWTPFGSPGIYSVTHGNQNGVVGFVLNDLPSATFALPSGTIGYGKITTNGNAAFGIYGLGELTASGGGVGVAAEFTCRNNSGNAPSTNLPPNEAIGTPFTFCDALHVTAGGDDNSSIGVYLSNEGGSTKIFNTGIYLSPTSFAQYGLFIEPQTTGGTPNVTSAVIQNNGTGINLQLGTTGTMVPDNAVIGVLDSNSIGRFKVAQNGVTTGSSFVAVDAAASVTTIAYGGTVAANTNCGTLAGSAGCVVINVGGVTRYIPYY